MGTYRLLILHFAFYMYLNKKITNRLLEVVDEIDFILQNLGSFLEHFCEFSVKWTLIAVLKLLSRNFFAQCEKNSSNQLFSNFFSKNVIFTKFLPKMYCVTVNFHNFHTVWNCMMAILSNNDSRKIWVTEEFVYFHIVAKRNH